jgi:hypothetical protein
MDSDSDPYNVNQERPTWLDLYDWRRRIASIYRQRELELQAGINEVTVWQRFRARKDALLAHHPQSPLSPDARRHFTGLNYFPYNPDLRLEAVLEPVLEPEGAEDTQDSKDSEDTEHIGATAPLHAGSSHALPLRRAAQLIITLEGISLRLIVYWIDVYGGGLFLPFRDATCPEESYGGGRYLCDTVKGSDLLWLHDETGPPTETEDPAENYKGIGPRLGFGLGRRVALDFNYAYNPSCTYDPRWVCPLAPKENWLPVSIRAGERNFRM